MASIPASETILEYLLVEIYVLLWKFLRTKMLHKIFVQRLSNTPQLVNTTSKKCILVKS